MTILNIMIGIALAGTIGILFFGLFSMARGGEFNKKNSNKLMRMRVIAQFATIILLGIFAAVNIGN
ncbi:MAG: twin transmembrane helix small protein [Sphingomonadales bacterium]|nr:twin transmembrane helix small protein [Sphingomonadales bacterium]